MPTTTSIESSKERHAIQAWESATKAGQDYTFRAVLAGTLLVEFRAELSDAARVQLHDSDSYKPQSRNSDLRMSHSGTSSLRGRNQHNSEAGFYAWLDKHGLCKTTAYRWMEAAERVCRKVLGLSMAEPLPTVPGEAIAVPISMALSAPESELTIGAIEFRRAVIEFLADKTLGEATLAAVDGEADGSRITRAAAGREAHRAAGAKERKAFSLYAGTALSDAAASIGARVDKRGGHWDALTAAQRSDTLRYLQLFESALPDEAVELLVSHGQQILRAREKGQQPEPLALRAAVRQDRTRAERQKR